MCLPWGCSANFLPTLNDTTRPNTFSRVRTGRDAFAGFSSLLSYFGEKPWSPLQAGDRGRTGDLVLGKTAGCVAQPHCTRLSPIVPAFWNLADGDRWAQWGMKYAHPTHTPPPVLGCTYNG